MSDTFLSFLVFVVHAILFVLEAARWIGNLHNLARRATGSDKLVEVRVPRILSPAAERALAEAEARRR